MGLSRTLILAALLWPSIVMAAAGQPPVLTTAAWIGSTGSTNLDTGSAVYFAVSGISGTSASISSCITPPCNPVVFITMAAPPFTVGISNTTKNLFCFVSTAPGLGKSWTFLFTTSGVAFNNTCVINDLNTSCSDTVHTSTTGGVGTSNIGIKVTPSGTPAAATGGCYMEADLN